MAKHATIALASQQPTIAPTSTSHETLILATAQIVSAYLVNRPSESRDPVALAADVYAALAQLGSSKPAGLANRAPTVPVSESVKPEYLVCLEDGKQVKMLKRYLRSNYNMSPEEYRARWNLPVTYPMVAPNYAKVRSQLAKKIGLGRKAVAHSAKRLKVAR